MKTILLVLITFILGLNNFAYTNDVNCDEFKKFSINYMKCKTNLIKDKTITAGQNFVKDTKEYQSEEWLKEKEKINKIKKKVLEK